MKAALVARLRRLETHHQTIEDSSLKVTFANLTILPRSYVGARHRIRIDKGNEGSGGVADYEERPGPGPAIECRSQGPHGDVRGQSNRAGGIRLNGAVGAFDRKS